MHPRAPANDLDDDGDGAGGDVFARNRERRAPTVAETWGQLVCPDDRPATGAALGAYLEGRVPIFDVEQRLRTASGEWKRIRARGTAVALDASSAPMRMVGTHSDISDRKQVEADLRLSADRLRGTVEGAVEAMGAMTAARDPYTAGHEKRVTELAVTMAAEMGRGEAAIEGLRLTGLVHDVGILTVPAEILNKPWLLTPIEFELIKGHAAAAHQILKPIDFEYPVADIVARHHERQDGSGYPAGLKDDEILPEARILAVADVVEAMASTGRIGRIWAWRRRPRRSARAPAHGTRPPPRRPASACSHTASFSPRRDPADGSLAVASGTARPPGLRVFRCQARRVSTEIRL